MPSQILPQESSLAAVLRILTSRANLQGQGRKSYCKSLVLLTKYVKKIQFLNSVYEYMYQYETVGMREK